MPLALAFLPQSAEMPGRAGSVGHRAVSQVPRVSRPDLAGFL